jgi:hypothetical protein
MPEWLAIQVYTHGDWNCIYHRNSFTPYSPGTAQVSVDEMSIIRVTLTLPEHAKCHLHAQPKTPVGCQFFPS